MKPNSFKALELARLFARNPKRREQSSTKTLGKKMALPPGAAQGKAHGGGAMPRFLQRVRMRRFATVKKWPCLPVSP